MDAGPLKHIINNRAELFAELRTRQDIIGDYVRGVALRYSTGLYLFGRPGTAKTHTVRAVLDGELNEPYVYRHGHLTPGGLFDLLAEHPEALIVLDDLVDVFRSDIALQILLSALEAPTNPDRTRVVQYQRKGSKESVAFRGGIVCITNRELHSHDLLGAFKSRVHILKYDPSDAHIGAHLLASAELGWPPGASEPAVPASETKEVAMHVLSEMIRLGTRFDLRVFYSKAIPDYLQWSDGETRCHWKDLVTASIQEHLIELQHHGEQLSRDEKKKNEASLILEIIKQHPDRREQVEVWKKRTGKSSRAFYRRLQETG
ncbi:hypothetical protein [Frigoriglobus tundricola]|uniref:AAA+ ATPase domain-containing protein n=1 Tax=Frigoriglobus tundricola TaxID=2774151 RepID=A0A6M5YIE9_9BACT|nr:hypothetical protein [Frigoriglobus tundricola]QJW93091.1 hypothetical protein FTUN_0594 [Frigoriglobus tundricola]